MDKIILIPFISLFIACGSSEYKDLDVKDACKENFFKKCATDRYATYNTLVECKNGQMEGGCFAGQCAQIGDYLFQFSLKSSTCQISPPNSFEFEDYIFYSTHPLRFLSFCGHNQVVIDETWGRGEDYSGLNSHTYEGEFIGAIFKGEHTEIYEGCKNTYTMAGKKEQ